MDGGGAELYRFVKKVNVAAYEQSKRFRFGGMTRNVVGALVKLSAKQSLVLEFLSKGFSNAQIVESTGLTLNTIRTHTKLAYQKLEVTSAMDAVAKARQLGLLP